MYHSLEYRFKLEELGIIQSYSAHGQCWDNPLVALSEAGTNPSTSTSTSKTRSRPDSEYVLYSYGEPVAMRS